MHDRHMTSAYWALRIAFGVVPIVAGLDKFTNLLVSWQGYLGPLARSLLPISPSAFMHVAGIVEVIVGIAILLGKARIFGFVACAWLAAIALELLSTGHFLDIAARDAVMAITGVTRYIKGDKGRNMLSIAVEPTASAVISQAKAGQELKPGPHKIQGLGAGFIPETLDLDCVDRVELVTNEESIDMARRLAKEEGILAGISCGAAVVAAVRVAKEPEMKGKMFVVILPDAAERYLSSVLFEGMFGE